MAAGKSISIQDEACRALLLLIPALFSPPIAGAPAAADTARHAPSSAAVAGTRPPKSLSSATDGIPAAAGAAPPEPLSPATRTNSQRTHLVTIEIDQENDLTKLQIEDIIIVTYRTNGRIELGATSEVKQEKPEIKVTAKKTSETWYSNIEKRMKQQSLNIQQKFVYLSQPRGMVHHHIMSKPLSELHPPGLHYDILVRISRMWEFRGPTDDDEIKHLDLVIVDDKKNAMYVEIPHDVIPYLEDKLQEGQVCHIENFLVMRAKPAFRPVANKYMIKLTRRTLIAPVNPEPAAFPKYVYTLTPLASLGNHLNKTEKFLDVLGQITAVSNAALVRIGDKLQVKKIIVLKDLRKVQLDLLGLRAHEFDEEEVLRVSEEEKQPVIGIFVGVLMKWLKDRKFLSGNSACRWYINEDILDIKEFYTNLPTKVQPVERIQLHSEQPMQNEIQEKTLLQLKEVCPFKQTKHRFRCTVTITKVVTDQGWYYPACTNCRTALPQLQRWLQIRVGIILHVRTVEQESGLMDQHTNVQIVVAFLLRTDTRYLSWEMMTHMRE
ncbi:hypothetical protein ACP70R_037508 [Stipagrostis hirtigluma subsp. patula]